MINAEHKDRLFCFIFGREDPDITVRVRTLNINYGQDQELMDSCRPLAEYAWLIRQQGGGETDVYHRI